MTSAALHSTRIAASLALLAAPAWAQAYHQRTALIGQDSFEIQVVGLENSLAAAKIGLDWEELQAVIEQRARAAGVVVLPVADDGAAALLSVKVILAYNEELDLAIWSTEAEVKQAILAPKDRLLYVSSWASGGYVGAAVLPRARKEVETSVISQVDRFLEDFQSTRREK